MTGDLEFRLRCVEDKDFKFWHDGITKLEGLGLVKCEQKSFLNAEGRMEVP